MIENKYDMEQIVDDLARAFAEKASDGSDYPPYDELPAMQKYLLKAQWMGALNIFMPIAEVHMKEVLRAEVVAQLRESIKAAEAMGLRAEDAIAVF